MHAYAPKRRKRLPTCVQALQSVVTTKDNSVGRKKFAPLDTTVAEDRGPSLRMSPPTAVAQKCRKGLLVAYVQNVVSCCGSTQQEWSYQEGAAANLYDLNVAARRTYVVRSTPTPMPLLMREYMTTSRCTAGFLNANRTKQPLVVRFRAVLNAACVLRAVLRRKVRGRPKRARGGRQLQKHGAIVHQALDNVVGSS